MFTSLLHTLQATFVDCFPFLPTVINHYIYNNTSNHVNNKNDSDHSNTKHIIFKSFVTLTQILSTLPLSEPSLASQFRYLLLSILHLFAEKHITIIEEERSEWLQTICSGLQGEMCLGSEFAIWKAARRGELYWVLLKTIW